jgi:alpha-galactosidase
VRFRSVTIFALSFPAALMSANVEAADVLAATPPMGWNSWNKFACNVSDELIRQSADAMVATGMKDAGYEYVVIDDCWQVERDDAGGIVPDPKRFPHGMKALADYIHAQGLKFGLYSDAGTATCQRRPGSKGHEAIDAATYADWGVDYLKYDWCNTEGQDTRESYQRMSRALAASGRPIVLSICEWGSTKPWTWAPGVGQLWRATSDIQDCWDCARSWGGMGVSHIIDQVADLYPYAGPGHWNDPDMLEVGNGGMSATEYRAHFSLWALMAAPLMAGNDIRSMPQDTADILTNREVIAVDQDPLGMQGRRVRDDGAHELWMKPLADGSRAVILFNRGSDPAGIRVSWDEIGLPKGNAVVRDLWQKEDIGSFADGYQGATEPHGVVMIRVTPEL